MVTNQGAGAAPRVERDRMVLPGRVASVAVVLGIFSSPCAAIGTAPFNILQPTDAPSDDATAAHRSSLLEASSVNATHNLFVTVVEYSDEGTRMNISSDNPFFDARGYPYVIQAPDALLEALAEAGCTYAWARQQHTVSSLDAECNELIVPFLASAPGAALGLLSGIIVSGLVTRETGMLHRNTTHSSLHSSFIAPADGHGIFPGEDDPFFTREDMLQEIVLGDGQATVIANLSILGWPWPTPAPLQVELAP